MTNKLVYHSHHLGLSFAWVYLSCMSIKLIEHFYFSWSKMEERLFYYNFSEYVLSDKSLGLVDWDFKFMLY